MADNATVNQEAVAAGLKSIRSLRSAVRDFVKVLSDGGSTGCGGSSTGQQQHQHQQQQNGTSNGTAAAVAVADLDEAKQHIGEVQSVLNNLIIRIRELESACTLLGHPSTANVTLGNSWHIGLDPAYERTSIYPMMINSFRFYDRMIEMSTSGTHFLQQNQLKRSQTAVQGRNRLMMRRNFNAMTQQTEQMLAHLQRQFQDMGIEILRPFGAPTVLKITLERVLRAILVLRGINIEWVLVKGYQEDFVDDEGKLDIWSESRYQVFRKVTEHANAAMLNYHLPLSAEIALRSYLTWLRSYTSLFSRPCKKCDRRLLNNMPPTWRDVRNLDTYHEICRP